MKKFSIFIVSIGIALSIQGNNFSVVSYNCTENNVTTVNDTIYNVPAGTAELIDYITYFRQNNKFKDWDKNNPKKVYLQGVVEINGTISDVRIVRTSEVKELDDEALRLIKSAKYLPGKNKKGEDVRSKYSIIVDFPAN